jgi:hypothetical protein
VFISNYVGDSLGKAFLKAQPIHYWTLSQDVPDYVPITLTTSGLNLFFPGLESHYGKDLPIDIEYSVERIGNFTAQENSQTLQVQLDGHMKFWVNLNSSHREVAIDYVLQNLEFKFSALIVDKTKVVFNITSVEIGAIVVLAQTFETINHYLLTLLLNKGIYYGLPGFNDYLTT